MERLEGAVSVVLAFRITAQGKFTVLHCYSAADGGFPNGPLLLAPDGSFYGVTRGQVGEVDGTVFRITLTGELTVLHVFTDGRSGISRLGGVVFGPDGALYGTGGAKAGGTVYSLTVPAAVH